MRTAVLLFFWLMMPALLLAQANKVYTIVSKPPNGDMTFCIGTKGPSGLPGDVVLSACGPSPYVSSGSVFPTATKAGTYVVGVAVENDPAIAPYQFSIQVFPGPATQLVSGIPGGGPLIFQAGKTLSIPLLTDLADQYGNII